MLRLWARIIALPLLCLMLSGTAGALASGPAADGATDLILRKKFSSPGKRPAGAAPPSPRAAGGARPAVAGGTAGSLPASPPPRTAAAAGQAAALSRAAALLGEAWVDSGTLYLRDGLGPGITVDTTRNPIVDFGSGRRVILAADGGVPAAEVAARWPGIAVVSLESGDTRSTLGALLEAAGYASVLRDTPVAFGRGAVVRFLPDFVVRKGGDPLLDVETYLLFVLPSPADALPAELREAARERRLRLGELFETGGQEPPAAAWRDPKASLTTVRARHPGVLLAELAETLGVALEREERALLARPGVPVDALVAELLARSGLPRVGPAVEFYRPGPAGRFTIAVPGWLVDRGEGQRLLVTPAGLGTQLRLYLTREGIGVFEYACP